MTDFFFLKVWAKSVGAHHTWQNTVFKNDITYFKDCLPRFLNVLKASNRRLKS